jgi:hypothetical protein
VTQKPKSGLGRIILQVSTSQQLHKPHTDEWSARRRDLYLTTYNSRRNRHPCRPAGFETAIPTSERPQTHALDRTATGIGFFLFLLEETSSSVAAAVMNFVIYISII